MSMCTRGDLQRALHVIDSSCAATLLAQALRKDQSGPKGQLALHCRLFLVGAILNAEAQRNFVVSDIH